MEHFYRNTQIVEYARMVDFIKDKPSNNYTGEYYPDSEIRVHDLSPVPV